MARWAAEISVLPIRLKWKQGVSNGDADALSRLMDPVSAGIDDIIGLDLDDNVESMAIYYSVLPLFSHWKNSTVYEPFRGSGRSARVLRDFGFKKVIHPQANFLNKDHRVPSQEFDLIISHPPRSLLKKIFKILLKIDKPFALWVPAAVATRDYCPKDKVQLVVLRGKLIYDDWKKPPRTQSLWLCWRMNLDSSLSFADLAAVEAVGPTSRERTESTVTNKRKIEKTGAQSLNSLEVADKRNFIRCLRTRRPKKLTFYETVRSDVLVRSLTINSIGYESERRRSISRHCAFVS